MVGVATRLPARLWARLRGSRKAWLNASWIERAADEGREGGLTGAGAGVAGAEEAGGGGGWRLSVMRRRWESSTQV